MAELNLQTPPTYSEGQCTVCFDIISTAETITSYKHAVGMPNGSYEETGAGGFGNTTPGACPRYNICRTLIDAGGRLTKTLPKLTLNEASEVTANSAKVSATSEEFWIRGGVYPQSSAWQYTNKWYFRWGAYTYQYRFRYHQYEETEYLYTGWTNLAEGYDEVEEEISGLLPNELYTFNIQARDADTLEEGEWSSIKYIYTLVGPVVEAKPASSVLGTSALVNGRITDDGGSSCQYRFRYRIYGAEYSYSSWANSKETGDSFSQSLTGLTARNLYEFAAQGKNTDGEGEWSASMYFRTLPASVVPQVYQIIERKVTLERIRDMEFSAGGFVWVDKEGNFHYDSRFARQL